MKKTIVVNRNNYLFKIIYLHCLIIMSLIKVYFPAIGRIIAYWLLVTGQIWHYIYKLLPLTLNIMRILLIFVHSTTGNSSLFRG